MPPELEEYLDTGDPPIVFTAGSAMRHGEDFFQASVEACQRIGRRALLVTRHPEQLPAELPAGIRHLDYAPFATLLPRTALMVHHGGIGTMAQGLAAGIPHLIMPLAHDQPDNAARIEQLGVGLSLARSAYRPRAVADRLNHLLNSPDVQAACQRLRGQIDFVAARRATCEAIEQLDPQQDARVRMSKTEVRPSHE